MFCQNCGKKFESSNKLQRYCPECQTKKKEEQKQKQKGYAKKRAERLNLVNITIYKEDKEVISNLAKEQGITMAEITKSLVAYMQNNKVNLTKQYTKTEQKTE